MVFEPAQCPLLPCPLYDETFEQDHNARLVEMRLRSSARVICLLLSSSPPLLRSSSSSMHAAGYRVRKGESAYASLRPEPFNNDRVPVPTGPPVPWGRDPEPETFVFSPPSRCVALCVSVSVCLCAISLDACTGLVPALSLIMLPFSPLLLLDSPLSSSLTLGLLSSEPPRASTATGGRRQKGMSSAEIAEAERKLASRMAPPGALAAFHTHGNVRTCTHTHACLSRRAYVFACSRICTQCYTPEGKIPSHACPSS